MKRLLSLTASLLTISSLFAQTLVSVNTDVNDSKEGTYSVTNDDRPLYVMESYDQQLRSNCILFRVMNKRALDDKKNSTSKSDKIPWKMLGAVALSLPVVLNGERTSVPIEQRISTANTFSNKSLQSRGERLTINHLKTPNPVLSPAHQKTDLEASIPASNGGIIGLENGGNDCFINSSLQFFKALELQAPSTPPNAWGHLSKFINNDPKLNCIKLRRELAIRVMAGTQEFDPILTNEATYSDSVVKKIKENGTSVYQQDAAAFLLRLLEQVGAPKVHFTETLTHPEGEVKIRTCEETLFPVALPLSKEIDDSLTVQEILNQTLTSEREMKWNDEDVITTRASQKIVFNDPALASFIISIGRFGFDNSINTGTKRDDLVKGVLTHIMLPLINGEQALYYPNAIICHIGDSVNSGHYICYRKQGNIWWKFDDSVVTKATYEENHEIISKNCYVISYVKSNASDLIPGILPERKTNSSSLDHTTASSSVRPIQHQVHNAAFMQLLKKITPSAELFPHLDCNPNILNLHACLKSLQKDSVSGTLNDPIIWSKEQHCFIRKLIKNSRNNFEINEKEKVNFSEILNELNNYVVLDQHYADSYSLEEQDPYKFIKKLLSPSINTHTVSMRVAHSGGIETISPSTSNSNNKSKSILLFGFNVPDRSGPLLDMETKFSTYFGRKINVELMSYYNNYIDMSTGTGDEHITFPTYLKFLDEAKRKCLYERVQDQPRNIVTKSSALSWARFLSENISKFNLAKKLDTEEKKKCFIAKNYKGITTNSYISAILKNYFNKNRWDKILTSLNPALELLKESSSQLIDNKDINIPSLVEKYEELNGDNQTILNSLLYGAFFRKASKLGLEFAKSQKIPVGFIWKLPDWTQSNPPKLTTLEQLYHYLKEKSYSKCTFNVNKNNFKYMEGVTSSEMRHLSRLQALGLLSIEKMAPNYLLIREIIAPSTTSSTVDSTAKSFKKMTL